jgi:ubiquinone/menaquinone biosynthesis C-methylase UbiE
MNKDIWAALHQNYKEKDWIDKPSIFAEVAAGYFPKSGKVLDLGAGQAQDSRYFADQGFSVVSTDLESSAQELAKSKLSAEQRKLITFKVVDLREELPFEDATFDVVYAHLSLHYFNYETTRNIFGEIKRVLKPGGMVAFLVNSTSDPEYKAGERLEDDYFQINKAAKRYFSVESARNFTKHFETILLDDLGETYKDNAKGVRNLVRFIGKKPLITK